MTQLLAAQPQTKLRRPMPRALDERVCIGLATALLLIVSVAFRLVDLGSVPGLNADEAWSGIQAQKFLDGKNFEWQTPTGNPINVFFWGPLVVLHAIFPPSIGLLRTVSVVSGLLAIALAYRLGKRVYDRQTAQYLALLLTCSPVAIAYSRFAWDSSQSFLAGCLVVFASLHYSQQSRVRARDWAILVALLLAAIWIHPTNVFLLPLTCCCVVTVPRRFLRVRNPGLVVAVFLVGLAIVLHGTASPTAFLVALSRVFSGAAVFQFISGGASVNGVHWFDVATWTFLTIAFLGFWFRVRTGESLSDLRLARGLGLSLAAFYFVAGQKGVAAHFERYALWCVVPSLLIAARGITIALPPRHHWQRPAFLAVFLLCVAWLASFYAYYLHEFRTTGGRSHLAFRISTGDLKLAILEQILDDDHQPTVIASRNWWTSLPLEYLMWPRHDVQVVPDYEAAMSAAGQRKFIVELVGSVEETAAKEFLKKHRIRSRRYVENDKAGNPVVVAFELLKPTAEDTASINRTNRTVYAGVPRNERSWQSN